MIEAFCGLVGGGKTFGSTRRMCEYIIRGGVVATNILFKGYDIDSKSFASDSPFLRYLTSRGWNYQNGQYVYISFDEMLASASWFSSVPGGASRKQRTLLCIDEATDLFDTLDRSKLNNDSIYRELFRFLRLSRHAHIDVLFICQDFFSINSRLRGLVGAIWKSTDLSSFRLPTFHIPLPFNCFLLQKFDRTGKLELYREFIGKDQRIFDIYESEAFHDALGITFSGVVGDGRIKGVKKMTRFQKLILFISVFLGAFSLFKLFRQDVQLKQISHNLELLSNSSNDVISTGIEISNNDPAPPPLVSIPVDRFERGEYQYSFCGTYPELYFNGYLIRLGMITEYGKCINITSTFTLCVDGDKRTFLLPCRIPGGPPKTTAFAPPESGKDNAPL